MILMDEWGLKGKETGQKLERMVKIHLPLGIISQADVKQWVFENWKLY